MDIATHREIAETADRHGFWFQSQGARLFGVDISEGRPVVFVHGGLADHRAALFHVGSLVRSCRLVAPDLRGSGRSIYAGALNWDQHADDVCALLDHLDIARGVVGGTSMGSGVALRFALRHADRLAGLILMSPLYPGADCPLPEAARVAMQVMGEAGERALEQGVDALRPLFEALPAAVREVAVEMMLSFDAASVAATTRFLATGVQPIASAHDLASILVPALLVPGADPQHPAEVAELYARHLRAVRVVQASDGVGERMARFCAELTW